MKITKEIFTLITIFLLLNTFGNSAKSQDYTNTEEIFLEYFTVAVKEPSIRKYIFPAERNGYPDFTTKDVYIFNDETPFRADTNFSFKRGDFNLYIWSTAAFFFYHVTNYIVVDSVQSGKNNGTLSFHIIVGHDSIYDEIKCNLVFTKKKDTWRITRKEILPLKVPQ